MLTKVLEPTLWDVCAAFIDKQEISCAEAVYQSDRVIENAFEFIEKICNIVGYWEDTDEEA